MMRSQPPLVNRALLGLVAGCAAAVAACGGASDRRPAHDASKPAVTVAQAQPTPAPRTFTLVASEPAADAQAEPAFQSADGPRHRAVADRIATHPVRNEDIKSWPVAHEVAATELVDWAQTFPQVASQLCEWDEQQSDRVKILTDWAATRRYEELEYFVLTHPSWEALRTMMQNPRGRAGLEAYVGWARRNSDAALELVIHPRGLSWAGRNVIAPEAASPRATMGPMR